MARAIRRPRRFLDDRQSRVRRLLASAGPSRRAAALPAGVVSLRSGPVGSGRRPCLARHNPPPPAGADGRLMLLVLRLFAVYTAAAALALFLASRLVRTIRPRI